MPTYFSPKSKKYRGTDGILRTVSPCSIMDREQLKVELNLLMKTVMDYPDKSVNFADLYVTDIETNSIANAVLQRCGIDPAILSKDLMYTFLFPYEVEGVEHDVGLLAELNDLVPRDIGHVSQKEIEKEYYRLLASLWNLNGDVSTALEAAKTVPADVLTNMMTELAFLRSGAEGKKAKLKQKAMEAAKELTHSGTIPSPNKHGSRNPGRRSGGKQSPPRPKGFQQRSSGDDN